MLSIVPVNKASALGLFREAELVTHIDVVLQGYIAEAERMAQEDEEFVRTEFSENMETAGFNEPHQRLAIGGVYNHLLMFGQLGDPVDNTENKPFGPLADAIAQYFTDFDGFKEAFKRAVIGRALPGWVWLGVCEDGRLCITQTNNEDNPLMHGVVDVQCVPICGIDLWEHAYLQQYAGDKGAYCEAFFRCTQWAIASANYEFYNSQNKATPVSDDA